VVAVGMELGGMVMGGVMGWAELGLGRRMVVMQERGVGIFLSWRAPGGGLFR